MPNPYLKFWTDLTSTIEQSGSSLNSIARMIEAETDPEHNGTYRKVCEWKKRDMPPESIAFLVALLEVIDLELVIQPKKHR